MVDYVCVVVGDDIGDSVLETLNHILTTPACLNRLHLATALSGNIVSCAIAIPSNLTGIKFVISYFSDDEYLENLMTDEGRQNPLYRTIALCMKPRFNSELFYDELGLAGTVGEQESVAAEKDDELESIIGEFKAGMQKMVLKRLPCGKALIRPLTAAFDGHDDEYDVIARASGKDVVVLSCSGNKANLPDSIDEKFIIIHYNPDTMTNLNPKFMVSASFSEGDRVACLGRYCMKVMLPEVKNDRKHANPLFGFDRVWADEATGVVYAMRKGNNIYIAVAYPEYAAYKIVIERIAQKWRRRVSTVADDNKLLNDVVGIDKAEFVKFSSENANSYIEAMKGKLKEVASEIGILQNKLVEHMKMHRQLLEVVTSFNPEQYHRQIAEAAQKQFEAVARMPKVKSIYVTDDGRVVVTTNEIHCRDPRTQKLHNIGCLYIEMNLLLPNYNEKDSITIKNLTHSIEAFSGHMVAPHIYEDGHICHGNLSQMIIQHYVDRDVYAVMEDLFAFVETVNTEDAAGKYINCWPEVEEKVEVEDATDDELLNALKGGK